MLLFQRFLVFCNTESIHQWSAVHSVKYESIFFFPDCVDTLHSIQILVRPSLQAWSRGSGWANMNSLILSGLMSLRKVSHLACMPEITKREGVGGDNRLCFYVYVFVSFIKNEIRSRVKPVRLVSFYIFALVISTNHSCTISMLHWQQFRKLCPFCSF